LMQSLRSRGFVKEVFNWQYLYYILTDEGVEHLREYLHISEDTVPNTLKKATKPQPPPSFRQPEEAGRGGRGQFKQFIQFSGTYRQSGNIILTHFLAYFSYY